MSSTLSLKSVDQTRVDTSSALRLFSQSRNLGNTSFCNIHPSNVTDAFGRPGNSRNLVTTLSSDCSQYVYPAGQFIADENLNRPVQVSLLSAANGSVDTLGVKRDYIPTSLYNSSTSNNFKTAGNIYKPQDPRNTYVPIYDASTLRRNQLQTSSLQQLN